MASAHDILARMNRAVAAVLESSDDDAVWLASLIIDWRAGTDFEAAAGLAPHWRSATRT